MKNWKQFNENNSTKLSGELERTINEMDIDTELKNQIQIYMKNNYVPGGIKGYPATNIVYRWNLHYIIDNIDKPNLLQELIDINTKKSK